MVFTVARGHPSHPIASLSGLQSSPRTSKPTTSNNLSTPSTSSSKNRKSSAMAPANSSSEQTTSNNTTKSSTALKQEEVHTETDTGSSERSLTSRRVQHGEHEQSHAEENAFIATAISFSTPEHSPFLLKKTSEIGAGNGNINGSSSGNIGVNSAGKRPLNQPNCNNQATAMSMDMSTGKTTCAPTITARRASVTPQEKITNSSTTTAATTNYPNTHTPASANRANSISLGHAQPQPSSSSQPLRSSLTSTSTNSTSAITPPSSSSPSRIPSLRPRKLSDAIHHPNQQQQQQHLSSTCSDSGSVPPSLCSSSGSPLSQIKVEYNSNNCSTTNTRNNNLKHLQSQRNIKKEDGEGYTSKSTSNNTSTTVPKSERTTTTSPYQSKPKQPQQQEKQLTTNHKTTATTKSRADTILNDRGINTSSPVPPSNSRSLPQARTPVRSPPSSKNGNRLHMSMDIAPFGSPGIFLSPYLPSPPDSRKCGVSTFNNSSISISSGMHGIMSSGSGGAGHIKNGTPTNFARDFGKTDLSSSSFDASNVLPWLSPTMYNLFSPGGGIASITNTPGGMFSSTPKSPRSPNGSKLSFPLVNETGTTDSTRKKMNGISSMICVSPLASRKNIRSVNIKNEKEQTISSTGGGVGVGGAGVDLSQPETPINFREVFASPRNDLRGVIKTEQLNEIPTLGHVNEADSNEEMCSRLSLEKHMAERDVREDEDLNVLLKLAENTPNAKRTEPIPSRAFRSQFAYPSHPGATIYPLQQGGEPPASLTLPYIGKNIRNPVGKTQQKKIFAGATSTVGLNPPPPPSLPIRSNSTSPRKTSPKDDKQKSQPQNPTSFRQAPSSFRQSAGPPKGSIYPTQYPSVPPHLHHPPPGVYPHPPPHFYYSYPPPPPGSGHPPPHPPYSLYSKTPTVVTSKTDFKKGQKVKASTPKTTATKRPLGSPNNEAKKRAKKTTSRKGGKRSRTTVTQPLTGPEREKSAANIKAINAATGNKNDKAASLASAILRGVTMRPSGKWQAQLYYAGKSRYIGVFDTREKAALAYEIAREKLKTDKPASEQSAQSIKETEANVNAARKAAFEGVNEKDPRHGK